MSTASKNAGGQATGALAGTFPTPALGIPSMVGVFICDDFIGENQNFGGQGTTWRVSSAVGTPLQSIVTPTTKRELGIHEFIEFNNTRFHTFHMGLGAERPIFELPIGSIFCTKICLVNQTTEIGVWAGFASADTPPKTGNAVDFAGIRYFAAGSTTNWEGVTRNATSESVVDMGITGGTGSFVILGFERTDIGYQMFQMDLRNAGRIVRKNIGDPVAVFNPNDPLTPVFGFETGTGTPTDRGFLIDFWGWGGRFPRE